jgi:hypothetical protein
MLINRVGKMLYKGGGFEVAPRITMNGTHVMSRTTLASAKGVFYVHESQLLASVSKLITSYFLPLPLFIYIYVETTTAQNAGTASLQGSTNGLYLMPRSTPP